MAKNVSKRVPKITPQQVPQLSGAVILWFVPKTLPQTCTEAACEM